MTALLKGGADIGFRDRESLSALMHAARYNRNPDVINTRRGCFLT
jgi:ankyrin repeat protein